MRSRQRVWLEPRLYPRVPWRRRRRLTRHQPQSRQRILTAACRAAGSRLPPYYRPTPYLASNNIYYPGQEEIGPDEMRISFIGSTPIPVTRPGRHLHHGGAGKRQTVLL